MPTITITTDELHEVVERVLPFRRLPGAGPPGDPLVGVQVSPAPDGLRWIATDRDRMACLYRGRSDLARAVTLPAELVDFAVRCASRSEVEVVTFAVEADHTVVTFEGPGLRVPRELLGPDGLDHDQVLLRAPDAQPAVLTAGGEALRSALHATVTFGSTEHPEPDQRVCLETIGTDTLQVRSSWHSRPDTRAHVAAVSDGPVTTVVNASHLVDLVDAAGASELQLFIGGRTEPLRVRTDDGFYGLVMPARGGHGELHERMADYLCVDIEDLVITDGGGVPIRTDDINLLVAEAPGSPTRPACVRFAAVMVTGVAGSPELLREVNELNTGAVLSRVLHTDSTLFVSADAVLDTLDDDAIDAIIAEIVRCCADLGPLLASTYGGAPQDGALGSRPVPAESEGAA